MAHKKFAMHVSKSPSQSTVKNGSLAFFAWAKDHTPNSHINVTSKKANKGRRIRQYACSGPKRAAMGWPRPCNLRLVVEMSSSNVEVWAGVGVKASKSQTKQLEAHEKEPAAKKYWPQSVAWARMFSCACGRACV
eukprot:4923690-Pleurochrysis_carterae.AAC.1